MTNPNPPGPYPPGIQGPLPRTYPAPKRPVPPDLDTARILWVCIAALGVVSIICAVIGLDGQAMARQLAQHFNHANSTVNLTQSQAERYVTIERVVIPLVIAAFWALVLLVFVRHMRAGKLWARALLTGLGVFEVIKGGLSLLNVGSLNSGLELASSAMSSVQAVLAVGAIYLMYRRDVNNFFLPTRHP